MLQVTLRSKDQPLSNVTRSVQARQSRSRPVSQTQL